MKKKVVALLFVIAVVVATLVITKYNDISAYYTHSDNKLNSFSAGELEVTVTEPNYVDNQIMKPNETIAKDPTYSNTGTVDGYIRAQIYAPISKIKYVDGDENIVTPEQDVEIFSYTLNSGWVAVEDNPSDTYKFNGIYEDSKGNKYMVHTYKYMEGGIEKVVEPGETIQTPVFSSISTPNYLDTDTVVSLKMYATAIAVQKEGGTAEEMWERFKNQNQAGIVGVN